MEYRKLVEIENELQNNVDLEELSSERCSHVQKLIGHFVVFYEEKYGVALLVSEDAAIIISYFYFSLCYEHVKPVVHDRMNRYKMASLMELVIVKEQLLIHPDETGNRKVNALFGMTAALCLINCMIADATKEFFCNTINVAINEKVHQMLEDHQLWLETKDLNDAPVFINAQFYELLAMINGAPLQANGF